jgi:hypothetical protein
LSLEVVWDPRNNLPPPRNSKKEKAMSKAETQSPTSVQPLTLAELAQITGGTVRPRPMFCFRGKRLIRCPKPRPRGRGITL